VEGRLWLSLGGVWGPFLSDNSGERVLVGVVLLAMNVLLRELLSGLIVRRS